METNDLETETLFRIVIQFGRGDDPLSDYNGIRNSLEKVGGTCSLVDKELAVDRSADDKDVVVVDDDDDDDDVSPPKSNSIVITFPANYSTEGRTNTIIVTSFDFKPCLLPFVRWADVVICHAGAGSILEALEEERVKNASFKELFPQSSKLEKEDDEIRSSGERKIMTIVNSTLMGNHQLELANALGKRGYLKVFCPTNLKPENKQVGGFGSGRKKDVNDDVIVVDDDDDDDDDVIRGVEMFKELMMGWTPIKYQPLEESVSSSSCKSSNTVFSCVVDELWNE